MSELEVGSISGPGNQPVAFPHGFYIGSDGRRYTNDIGVPGQVGFGVGICPGPLPSGIEPIYGYNDLYSDTLGNYINSDGSILVWRPTFFYKLGTGSNGLAVNAVDIKPFSFFGSVSAANAAGYAVCRDGYDGGLREGYFIDKYLCSNNNGIFSSIKGGIPVDTDGSQSGVGAINGCGGVNNYGMVQQAAKSRGANWHAASIFMYKAAAMLSCAHARASTGTAWCAWYDPAGVKSFPKGCNNNALGDVNDADLIFESAGHGVYPAKPKAGSANIMARCTHNGQNSGISDINGSMWQAAFGLTSDGTNYYALKTSKRMRDMTGSNNSGADSFFGATGIAANYDSLGVTIGAATASGSAKTMGSAAQVLSEASSGSNWQATGAGIPLAGGVGGTNAFGNDGLWDYRSSEMCPIVGANWAVGSSAGVWALNLNAVRSDASNSVGGRAALYL